MIYTELPHDCGEIINPYGFGFVPTGNTVPGAGWLFGLTALWGWRRKRIEYEFTLRPDAPLTYRHPGGYYIQADKHGITDMGSIPEQLQVWYPKDSHNAAFLPHDSVCRVNESAPLPHCLYYSRSLHDPYKAEAVTWQEAHHLLGMMIIADGGYRMEANIVFKIVRRFGPRW